MEHPDHMACYEIISTRCKRRNVKSASSSILKQPELKVVSPARVNQFQGATRVWLSVAKFLLQLVQQQELDLHSDRHLLNISSLAQQPNL